MVVYRCVIDDCRAVLFEADLKPGSAVRKICPKCKVMNVVGGEPISVEPQGDDHRSAEPRAFQNRLNLVRK